MKNYLTNQERQILADRLAEYRPKFSPGDVEFYWQDFWLDNTCAYFCPPNKIFLNVKHQLLITDRILDDVICHELYHAYQYQEQGWLKYAIRNLSHANEKDAYAEQERVRKLIEE